MKKIVLLGAAAIMAISCSTQKEEISVKLENLTDQKVIVKYSDLTDTSIKTVTDTVQSVAGAFNIDLPDTSSYEVVITPETSFVPSTRGKRVAQESVITLYVKQGEKIKVNGSADGYKISYTVKGSMLSEDFAKLRGSFIDNQAMMLPMTLILDTTTNQEAGGAIIANLQEISNAIKQIKADFVKNNPANELSGIILSTLDSEPFYELLPQLAPNVTSGAGKSYLEKTQKRYDRSKAIDAAKAVIIEGNPAPDFTLTDINGNPLTLSSLRGKYVVLDFWGKWCIWCVRGIPEMKTTYEKVKSKFEFVGVDHGDTEEVWKAAVAEYQLPWLQVYNGKDDNDITVRYGVNGFPTKIIIDPQGNIAYVGVGESKDFYTKINELYKKR